MALEALGLELGPSGGSFWEVRFGLEELNVPPPPPPLTLTWDVSET